MNRGNHDGAPRYRNPNNIYMFRHALNRSEELGITRHACLPENELAGEDPESAISAAAVSLGREINGKAGMNFSRLVKTSLQGVNLDRKASGNHCIVEFGAWFGSVKDHPPPPPPKPRRKEVRRLHATAAASSTDH